MPPTMPTEMVVTAVPSCVQNTLPPFLIVLTFMRLPVLDLAGARDVRRREDPPGAARAPSPSSRHQTTTRPSRHSTAYQSSPTTALTAPPLSSTTLMTTGGGMLLCAQDAGIDNGSIGSALVGRSASTTTGSPSELMANVLPLYRQVPRDAIELRLSMFCDEPTTRPIRPAPPVSVGSETFSEKRDNSAISPHTRCAESISAILRSGSENKYFDCCTSIDRARWSMNGIKCCNECPGCCAGAEGDLTLSRMKFPYASIIPMPCWCVPCLPPAKIGSPPTPSSMSSSSSVPMAPSGPEEPEEPENPQCSSMPYAAPVAYVPHPNTFPSSFRNQVHVRPAATNRIRWWSTRCSTRLASSTGSMRPVPNSPLLPLPNVNTVPSETTAAPCARPADIEEKPRPSSSTSVGELTSDLNAWMSHAPPWDTPHSPLPLTPHETRVLNRTWPKEPLPPRNDLASKRSADVAADSTVSTHPDAHDRRT
mmetsp:Transcript_1628/g.5426  ORF Transcript_1628/g.5426 Transcript_1628/m.5426 type:complete len:479 (-) Transcript_1628:28-1464(-)